MRSPTRLSLLSTALLTLTLAVPATAQDDRATDAPTKADWGRSLTASDLSNLRQRGYRITDLDVRQAFNGGSYDTYYAATWVDNEGDFDKRWAYSLSRTAAYISTNVLAGNNWRIVDLESYVDQNSGEVRHAAVYVENTGVDRKSWWWYPDVAQGSIASLVQSHNARLVQLERFIDTAGRTRFSIVMIANTGSDARAWSYGFAQTRSQIDSWALNNSMRIYNLERIDSSTFDVIFVRDPQPLARASRLISIGEDSLRQIVEQDVLRIYDIDWRSTSSGLAFDVLYVDRANDHEDAVRTALATTNGAVGAYLRQIYRSVQTAPVLDINEEFVFEPAGAMHLATHFVAMREVQRGNLSANNLVSVPLGISGACPTGGGSTAVEGLYTVLDKMLKGDNRRGYALTGSRWSIGTITRTFNDLNMNDSDMNHIVGCGGPTPNEISLNDLYTLLRAGATLTATVADDFIDLMDDDPTFPRWGGSDLIQRVQSIASRRRWDARMTNSFVSQIDVRHLASRYTISGRHYISEVGIARIPTKTYLGLPQIETYAFGVFSHGATVAQSTSQDAVSNAALETLLGQIVTSMDAWEIQAGQATPFGSSCPAGSNVHDASGSPFPGEFLGLDLNSGPPTATATILVIGVNRTNHFGLPLPFRLPGTPCDLLTGPILTVAGGASPSGYVRQVVQVPNDPGLSGSVLYSQYLVIDPNAPGGMSSSNGLELVIGG